MPTLQEAEVEKLTNGPEGFTPDSRWLVGRSPKVRYIHFSQASLLLILFVRQLYMGVDSGFIFILLHHEIMSVTSLKKSLLTCLLISKWQRSFLLKNAHKMPSYLRSASQ